MKGGGGASRWNDHSLPHCAAAFVLVRSRLGKTGGGGCKMWGGGSVRCGGGVVRGGDHKWGAGFTPRRQVSAAMTEPPAQQMGPSGRGRHIIALGRWRGPDGASKWARALSRARVSVRDVAVLCQARRAGGGRVRSAVPLCTSRRARAARHEGRDAARPKGRRFGRARVRPCASRCAGGRMCTWQEWEAAMRGDEGFLYPWGNEFQLDAVSLDDPVPWTLSLRSAVCRRRGGRWARGGRGTDDGVRGGRGGGGGGLGLCALGGDPSGGLWDTCASILCGITADTRCTEVHATRTWSGPVRSSQTQANGRVTVAILRLNQEASPSSPPPLAAGWGCTSTTGALLADCSWSPPVRSGGVWNGGSEAPLISIVERPETESQWTIVRTSFACFLRSKGIGPSVRSRPLRRGPPQGCIRREGTSEAVPAAVRQAVGGGCQSGWGRLLSVTNAIETGHWRQGDSGWA